MPAIVPYDQKIVPNASLNQSRTFSKMAPMDIQIRIKQLEALLKSFIVDNKMDVVKNCELTKSFFSHRKGLEAAIQCLAPEEQYAIYSVTAIGEGEIVFYGWNQADHFKEKLKHLAEDLCAVEKYFDSLGGIIGYHLQVLKLIAAQDMETVAVEETYSEPPGTDLTQVSAELRRHILKGIESLSMMAEIYPIGGAGDRLDLRDEHNACPLPVALLPFNGVTLLEGLIRDLWAKEYLYYKLFNRQIEIPIAFMTSHEKNNDAQIKKICKDANWFGRHQAKFRFFIQPLVPVLTSEGHWSMTSPLSLFLKPGGHGMLWKVAYDSGTFDWFKDSGVRKGLIRQINNPLASTDYGILAFLGIGCEQDKTFGFASCFRLAGAAEGINILIEKLVDGKASQVITNIEYTDFAKKGIQDTPIHAGSAYSRFPANTNLLFVDLERVRDLASRCPAPGLIINMKKEVPFTDASGHVHSVKGGRLESTMQNLADELVDTNDKPHQTFLTYNHRRKTISVTKNAYKQGKSMLETPEGCFYDQQRNHHELLAEHCGFALPPYCDETEYLQSGPSTLFLFHPALGPLWSIIGQKLCQGKMAAGSEIQLEVAEICAENLSLEGSLIVKADNIMGRTTAQGRVVFSEENGKCTLKNVVVKNKGIDRAERNLYWKNQIHRLESMEIHIEGSGEFIAEDVVFEGNHRIVVPDGVQLRARMDGKKIVWERTKLDAPSWCWQYKVENDFNIICDRLCDHR